MIEFRRKWSAGILRMVSQAHKHLLLLFTLALSLPAQRPHPAEWSLVPETTRVTPGSSVLAKLELKLQEPWHMYSMTTPPGGPIPTAIKLEDHPAIQSWSVYQPPAQRKFDSNFGIDTDTYEKQVKFYLTIVVKPNAPPAMVEITARMRYQLCTDKECMPPRPMTAFAKLEIIPGPPAAAPVVPAQYVEYRPGQPGPVETVQSAPPPAGQPPAPPQDFGSFIALAFGFGLAAVFTPCVFPMIPITISFFLNQGSGSRGQALSQAIVFCLGIILLFAGLGFGITAATGPFGIVQLGNNVWVNLFIALVFFAFGLSLLGAFEITLPSGLLTRLNTASNRGGYAGTLLMGLTFSLTAFACVGPFVGTLLAASVTGDKLQPLVGMVAFAAGLATPFFFLALFPGYLQSLPRSGGWMARVKIVMGFLILAAMLKYLATVDQVFGWNVLSRERFLGLWIVLLALPGLYLLGLLRMEGIKPDEPVGTARLLVSTMLLGFSLALIPGMFGARLGDIEAFIPPPREGFAIGDSAAATVHKWLKDDYDGAIAKARAENKLVFLNFTGYACTNCKWMKANMFPKTEISAALSDFVLAELYTDGTDAASEANQQRQESMFKTVAIPFYAIVDTDGKVIATFAGLTKDTQEFLKFLKTRT